MSQGSFMEDGWKARGGAGEKAPCYHTGPIDEGQC